jgi:hypothetical protein
MDLPVHNQILWHACVEAERRLGDNKIGSPTACYPYLVCGSWMNDMNQSTIFTDFIGTKNNSVDKPYSAQGAIDGVFKVLWIEELKKLLHKMDLGSAETAAAASAFRTLFPDCTGKDSTATASFGRYCRFDHLDVLENSAPAENAAWNRSANFVSESIKDTVSYLKYSFLFLFSTFDVDPANRLSRDKITALGRSLHSFEDFYAHSNYVELLLWELAYGERLKPGLVDEFNSRSRFPICGDKLRPYCPLPTRKDEIRKLIPAEDDSCFRARP